MSRDDFTPTSLLRLVRENLAELTDEEIRRIIGRLGYYRRLFSPLVFQEVLELLNAERRRRQQDASMN